MIDQPRVHHRTGEYSLLTRRQVSQLNHWIRIDLTFEFLEDMNSYELKHEFESACDGFYVTNEQFIEAMFGNGYKVKTLDEDNGNIIFEP